MTRNWLRRGSMASITVALVVSLISGSEASILSDGPDMQEPVQGQDLEYRMLSTSRISTMEKEMNEAAEEGFRLAQVWTILNVDLMSIMSRPENGEPVQRYEYRLLGVSRTGTMEEEIKEAAREGFTYFTHDYSKGEYVVVLERDLEAEPPPYEYKVLSEGKLEEQVGEAERGYFELLGFWARDEISIVRRPASPEVDPAPDITAPELVPADVPAPTIPEREYRSLETDGPSKMEERLNELAREGFRLDESMVRGASRFDRDLDMVMSRVVKSDALYEYRVLATTRAKTMREELQEAAEEGYVLRAGSWSDREVICVLERDADSQSAKYEYEMLITKRTSTLEKEMIEIAEKGFEPLGVAEFEGWFGQRDLGMILRRPHQP